MNVLIVGCGVVGSNLSKEIASLNPDVVDKYKPEVNKKSFDGTYDLAFICVDTPKTSETDCDTSEVLNAINENDAKVYVIKSTVPPKSTRRLACKTGKYIVFSPEYYGGTQHCNNFEFDFTILGGDKDVCIFVQQILQKVYDARHRFYITDSTTAELTKYMENSWLAAKVSFCVQFYDIANKYGVSYEQLRELFVLDPRVNASHTFVYRDHPFWESHCLDKDVPTIANLSDAPLLKSIIEFNESHKNI